MAGDLRAFVLEKAELLSSRLKELASSGLGYVQAQLGVDLGLKPELYPTWVVLCTAVLSALLLLGASWAAISGGLQIGRKRRSSASQGSGEAVKAEPEEPRRRNRKKTTEKVGNDKNAVTTQRDSQIKSQSSKSQSNGQPVIVAQEEVKVTKAVSKLAPHIITEKVQEVQGPVPVKKNKKKNKSEVKQVQRVFTDDGKEPDDGVWETKVSNREKRQQRRKEKGPEDSSPGGAEAPITHVEAPGTTVPTKKNRGKLETQHARMATKVDSPSGAASSPWREEPSVNGGGWSNMSLKVTGQMGSVEGRKWSTIPTAAHYRPQPEPQPWAQESQAAWRSIDARIKADLRPVSFPVLGLNTADPLSNAAELQWANYPSVEDEWSGFNGIAAADPSSDWNAPVEHWGNYEEPLASVEPAPLQKDPPLPNKVSEDEKDAEDPSGGTAKSKKKRKKKKKIEEEVVSDAQRVSTVPTVGAVTKAHELPVTASKKHNTSISPSQKNSDQMVEPPKPSQKKKINREP